MQFSGLPPEIPEEKFESLVDKLADDSRKIGLYVNGVALNVDEDDTPDKMHMLVMQFVIGDVAFSDRVQDPEADEFDLEFKKIEKGTIIDQMQNIREQYEKYDEKKEEKEE